MKKIPGENSNRSPRVGDLVKFDITWCEGLGAEGNIWADIDPGPTRMFQYGIVTNIDERKGHGFNRNLERHWRRYYIVCNGVNLMFFGNEDLIEVVEEKNE